MERGAGQGRAARTPGSSAQVLCATFFGGPGCCTQGLEVDTFIASESAESPRGMFIASASDGREKSALFSRQVHQHNGGARSFRGISTNGGGLCALRVVL